MRRYSDAVWLLNSLRRARRARAPMVVAGLVYPITKESSTFREIAVVDDAAARIMKMKGLLDAGAISQAMFEEKKQALINHANPRMTKKLHGKVEVPITFAPPHPSMMTAVDRMPTNLAATSSAVHAETLGKARPQFVKEFHSRVERIGAPLGGTLSSSGGTLSLYTRAQADLRPASIAHLSVGAQAASGKHYKVTATPGDAQWGSVSLRPTVSSLFLESVEKTGSALYAEPPAAPDRLIPLGEKKLLFEIERLGEDDYRFTSKVKGISRGPSIEPGVGKVCDSDTTPVVVAKLHAMYPVEVPLYVPRGDAVAHGVPPQRHVRTLFESRGLLLVEGQPVGEQCLRKTFSSYFHPRAERTCRVNLAARARADDDHRSFGTSFGSRPDSVAFPRVHEYMERSTFMGGNSGCP